MSSKVEIRNQSTEYRNTGLPEDRITGRQIKIRNPQSAIHNPQSAIRNPQSVIGFTLIELLVVVTVIVLLVGILAPSVGTAIKRAANVRTIARVAGLAGGCNMYHTENEYYPGQRYPNELKGSSGNFTGSQWLAKSLFYDPDATPKYPQPKYCPLKGSEDLVNPMCPDVDGFNIGTISDRNTSGRGPMPILYYPARVGESGLTQYKEADNITYTSGVRWYNSESLYPGDDGYNAALATFYNYIKDRRFQGNGSTTPYHPEEFLIIAAGLDRLYGTDDDICYPAFSGD